MDVVKLFNNVLAASFIGSVFVLIILLAKSIFMKKLNSYFHYYIWILLIIKLLLPYSVESNFSVNNVINLHPKDNIEASNLIKTISAKSFISSHSEEVDTSSKELGYGVERENTDTKLTNKKYNLGNVIGVTWLLGAFFMIFLVVYSSYRVRYIIKNSMDYPNQVFNNIFANCIDALKVKRKVRLVYTNKIASPALYGVITPTVIIPLNVAKNIDSDEFRYIALHELSHLKRKDIFLNLIITLLQCIYWFNPIVLYGLYKMKQDCEIACDRHVISYLKSYENIRYGEALIKMIKLSSSRQWIPIAASLSNNKFEIKRRITMITKYKKLSIGGIIFGGVLIALISFIGLTNGIAKADIPNNSNNVDIKAAENIKDKSTKSLTITLEDNMDGINKLDLKGPNLNYNPYLVHVDDILSVTNELKDLGAVKISINGVQISERSEIQLEGPFLNIDGNRYTVPFIIKTEFNKDISEDILLKEDSVINELKARGILVNIEN